MGSASIVRGLLPLAVAAAAACSDGSKSAPTQVGHPSVNHIESAPILVSATSDAGDDSGVPSYATDSYAVAVPMQPWMQCDIHPEGAGNDPVHSAVVSAGADGELRFFAPSADWGTRLTLQCSLDGTSQPTILLDLDDSSTFIRRSMSDLEPQLVGVRPALTGDLSSLSLPDIIQQGYPPRPDAAKDPQRYAKWAQHVANPMQIFRPVPTAVLGLSFGTGTYEGNSAGPWTGFIQGASGFNSTTLVANYGTFYDMYFAETLIPEDLGCPTGDACVTAIWAGIGGYPLEGILGGGSFVPGLIQSGFTVQSGTNLPYPGAGTYLFIEYTSGGAARSNNFLLPPSGDLSANFDDFGLWGWTSTSSACALSTTATYGCFAFDDYTHSWGFGATPLPQPVGTTWSPATVDYIVENPLNTSTPYNNADYWFDVMEGDGWDFSGEDHADPGNSSGTGDPYVHVHRVGSPEDSSEAVWDNSGETFNTDPTDPMYFIWQTY